MFSAFQPGFRALAACSFRFNHSRLHTRHARLRPGISISTLHFAPFLGGNGRDFPGPLKAPGKSLSVAAPLRIEGLRCLVNIYTMAGAPRIARRLPCNRPRHALSGPGPPHVFPGPLITISAGPGPPSFAVCTEYRGRRAFYLLRTVCTAKRPWSGLRLYIQIPDVSLGLLAGAVCTENRAWNAFHTYVQR